jgi:hypothetical protein
MVEAVAFQEREPEEWARVQVYRGSVLDRVVQALALVSQGGRQRLEDRYCCHLLRRQRG